MIQSLNLNDYYNEFISNLQPFGLFEELELLKSRIINTKLRGGKIVLIGNGASASIASHAALDLSKQAGIRSLTFNDATLITALVNDISRENWLIKACDIYIDGNDLVIFISVSGESPNLVNAAKSLSSKKIEIVSFTGKKNKNSLMSLSDQSFKVNSNSYNIVESIHMIWITSVIDLIIGKSEYEVSSSVVK